MTTEKTLPQRKISKLADMKKPLIIGGIIIIIAISGIIGGIIYYLNIEPYKPVILIFGTAECSGEIDPLAATTIYDSQVIDQVAEGLFDYNYLSEYFEPIPNLALDGIWSDDNLNLTCHLRTNVKFHDGTLFNAQAVNWNFNRIHRLINESYFGYPHLWFFSDGKLIINHTEIIDDYTIKFVLNAPYSPLKSLLAFYPSYIVSPDSTPPTNCIDVLTGDLIGTGPYIFDIYEYGANVSLKVNPNYWAVKPKVDRILIYAIEEPVDRINALLSGEIDMLLNEYYEETTLNPIKTNPNFTVYESKLQASINFFVFNNKLINATMRKSISYAINSSSILVDFWKGTVIRAQSPIPEGVLYHNISGINVPDYDISIARQTLKDAGWPGTTNLTANNNITASNEWEKLVDDGTPLATYNYTVIDGSLAFDLGDPLTKNLKQIGVKVEVANISFFEYIFIMGEYYGYHRNMFELSYAGWAADFNDPSNILDPFHTNKLYTYNQNCAQVNDIQVQQWMEQALREANETAREQLYYKIQKRLLEEVYPYYWLYTKTPTDIYVSNLRGWYPNPYKTVFKTVKFV
jgi:peptide/nickel transport system substrate-binding protein